MFDWLRSTAQWLSQSFTAVVAWLEVFVGGMPMYVAGPAMLVIGALDSSLLSLPEINDYLVVIRCTNDHSAAFYFPLFAAAGSVIGCLLLYAIIRRGGQAVLRRRFRAEHIERVERTYARFGFLAIAVPALLPPPMPFKIFVATAGALEYPRWRFVITVMIARSLRYYIEGALAVFYGRQVIDFIKTYGFPLLAVVFAVCIIGLAIYLIAGRRKRRALAASGGLETTAEITTTAGMTGEGQSAGPPVERKASDARDVTSD
ncbi:MAG TPA: VTT domain-containing protein [Pyrinomonadaceae bacterium]|jgi:membrane protein YqaA with SNARE-associated domain